jgi:hypothetical protein
MLFINSPVSLWINVPFPILSQFGNLNEMSIGAYIFCIFVLCGRNIAT